MAKISTFNDKYYRRYQLSQPAVPASRTASIDAVKSGFQGAVRQRDNGYECLLHILSETCRTLSCCEAPAAAERLFRLLLASPVAPLPRSRLHGPDHLRGRPLGHQENPPARAGGHEVRKPLFIGDFGKSPPSRNNANSRPPTPTSTAARSLG